MLSVRDAVKTIARRLGYDIHRIGFFGRPIDFLRSRDVDLVVDVGANVGQYGSALRCDGYAGWLFSLEPTSVAYESLAERARRDGRWKALNIALGKSEGTAEINVSVASEYSSFLQQTAAAKDFNAGTTEVFAREKVRVARLDDIFAELPEAKAPFLKLDVQGFEQQVLLGASDTLSRFVGVQLELPIVPLYGGTWRFHEAIAFMSERGFEVASIVPVNYDKADTVSLLEIDCIFRRADAH